jgi:phospholipid/cholesterol/gamma-HCH transport system substrate-binding protein
MSKSRLELRVGLFVFVALTLLAALMLMFGKGATFYKRTHEITLITPNVGGLKTRAQVLMAGVQIGTVSGITLGSEGTNVNVTLSIYNPYRIHKDALFAIEQSGFLGDQYVAIYPTTNKAGLFQHGDTAYTEPPFNLQEVARSAGGFIQRIDETARKLNDAISDVRRLVLNEKTLTNLSVAAANICNVAAEAEAAVQGINLLVATNSPAIAQSASNLVAFSEELHQFGGGLGSLLATNRPEIDASVKNIETSTEMLKSLVGDVQSGKGPAGTILKNEEVTTHISEIASNLSITTSNLNRLGLWGILWQHKPPKSNQAAAKPEK